MPGSGYVVENVYKPSQKAQGTYVGTKPSYTANSACYGTELAFPFYRKSFRSGSAFDRYLKVGSLDRHLSEVSLIENLLAQSGTDVGHEYEVKKITEWKSSFHYNSGSSLIGQRVLPGTFYVPGMPTSPNVLTIGAINDYITFDSGMVTDNQLRVIGTRLINLTNPLKPPVTLAVSLAELFGEGLPAIIGKNIFSKSARRGSLIAAAGSEWLNYAFGITPILSDVMGVMQTMRQANAIVRQWQKNEGEKIRRRRTWEGNNTSTRYDSSLSAPNIRGGYYRKATDSSNEASMTSFSLGAGNAQSGVLESYTQERIQYAFAASFQYSLEHLLPDIPEPFYTYMYGGMSDKDLEETILYQHLVGLDQQTATSADTLWNVLPFSWLIDWFVNFGDLIANFTTLQEQGVMLDYGYVSALQERRFTAVYTQQIPGDVISGTVSITGIRHRRIRATPFGFGSGFSGLNPFQTSILASLATSKFR